MPLYSLRRSISLSPVTKASASPCIAHSRILLSGSSLKMEIFWVGFTNSPSSERITARWLRASLSRLNFDERTDKTSKKGVLWTKNKATSLFVGPFYSDFTILWKKELDNFALSLQKICMWIARKYEKTLKAISPCVQLRHHFQSRPPVSWPLS